MKIAVRFLGLPPSPALREHSERQALFHLSRFGEDMECKVSAKGHRVGFASIVDLSADAYASVGMALSRLSRSIARALDRARGMRGIGPAHRLVE